MKIRPLIICITLLFAWQPIPSLPAATANVYQTNVAQALRMCLAKQAGPVDSRTQLINAAIRFYEDRRFQPAWMSSAGVTSQGAALLDALRSASDENTPRLNAYVRYLEMILQDGNQYMSFSSTFPLDAMLKVDLGMTLSALYFVLQNGTEYLFPDENTAGPPLPQHPTLAAKLVKALPGTMRNALLKAIPPREKPYLALKESLNRFESIQRQGGWPTIPAGQKIVPGQEDPRVPILRKRLLISGDIDPEASSLDQRSDESLVDGIRRFQMRHGLRADGIVGPDTLAELNISIQERIAQIKLNLMRWCRLPESLGQRYLLVNIPGFKLNVVENHHVVDSMRAIVGTSERRTPVFSAVMTYMEINPYWNIPRQIAGEDILPKIHHDPNFLQRQNIQVFNSWQINAPALDPMAIDWKRYSKEYFPFRLRQDPSASNALGQFKFIFPNHFSVYIHDTPAKSLFSRNRRSFSSGCVRIEKPLTLANYLLAAQGWDGDKIQSKVKSRKRRVVVLDKPIAVHLVYLTAWADRDGTIHFFHDLYERDERQIAEIKLPDCTELPTPADLMAIDRILDRDNDRTASKPSRSNGDPEVS
jgi:murein L,D-transpeptidase YcbB/YkuD